MAEKENPILRFIQGLNRDSGPIDQPLGTLRYARNAIVDGPNKAITNEASNANVEALPLGSKVIGTVPVTGDVVIYFLKDGARSEIGIYRNGVYTTVFNPPLSNVKDHDMKFNVRYPIEGEFKYQANGSLIVYWTDDLNPPRALNITRQMQFSSDTLYGVVLSTSPDTAPIGTLNLFPYTGPVPHVELDGVYMGGGCLSGVYYLALGYTDSDLVESDYVTLANPVQIVDDVENVNPMESYDGAPAGTVTGKSITWDVSNINTDRKYLSVAVLQKIGGEVTAVKLKNVEISGSSTLKINYSGDENYVTLAPEEVLVDNVRYTTAKTIQQLDNVLYLGNLKSNLDLGYQKYANFICAKAITKEFDPFDPFILSNDNLENKKVDIRLDRDQGYRYAENIFQYLGYMREEVYAFYIAFILKDGSLSYAYHIPGREPLKNVDPSQLHDENICSDPTINEDQLQWGTSFPDFGLQNIGSEQQSRFFHWYDFSTEDPGNMNYWHNLNEKYPDTENFDVVNASNPNQTLAPLRGKNVRHHRFPSNGNADFSSIKGTNAADLALESGKKATVHWYWFGGFDYKNGDWTVAGKWPNQNDPAGARDWQGTNYPNLGNQGMGGEGSSHDNNPEISWDANNYAPWMCDARYNSNFSKTVIQTIFGCDIDSLDDVDFIYDTNIPPGVRVMIQWDYPHLDNVSKKHCWGTAYADVNAVNGDILDLGNMGGDLPKNIWKQRPGYIAWVECSNQVDGESPLEHEVRALGLRLCNLKIPKEIADQVQGFRIYRAKRDHEDRTVLGQSVIHNMETLTDVDPSGCDGGGINVGIESYFLATGLPHRTIEQFRDYEAGFHDFYLLNGQKDITAATHLKMQYSVGMFNFQGPTRYYYDAPEDDLSDPNNPIYSCWKKEMYSSFHMGGEYHRFYGYRSNGTQSLFRNIPLYDKAKAYIPGNTIFEGRSLGFQRPIYNIGGETLIGLRTERLLPYLPSDQFSLWRQLRSDNSQASYVNYTGELSDVYPNGIGTDAVPEGGLMLGIANLKAFRSDVYAPADTQELVWTGYEVVGSDLDKFVVDENNQPVIPNTDFESGDIFGGDTYICRYGYRTTHREELSRQVYSPVLARDHKSVISIIVESTDNINFRHIQDQAFPYFPGAPLSDVLKLPADVDLTWAPDRQSPNMAYNEDYSSVNDLKAAPALPWQLEELDNHPVDVIRSGKASAGSLIDNYRQYNADQIRSLNNDRGELWKIIAIDNILLFHMEDSILRTKGKQRMQVSEGNDAYVGQGDIFEQEPDDLKMTDGGYMGTRSQWAGIVTPYGYFCVDNLKRNIFLVGQSIENLASGKYGLEDWFNENLPFELSNYGYDSKIDSPIEGMGFVAVWDERNSRIILTKREFVPTDFFILAYKGSFSNVQTAITNSGVTPGLFNFGIVWVEDQQNYYLINSPGGALELNDLEATPIDLSDDLGLFEQKGWTISFAIAPQQDGRAGVWASFHDYIPYWYTQFEVDFLSYTDQHGQNINRNIFKHNDEDSVGRYYGVRHPFEVEMIHNMYSQHEKLFSSFDMLVDVYGYNTTTGKYDIVLTESGFDSFLLYTNDASSGIRPLEYLINMRKLRSSWHVNKFRDLSAEQTSTGAFHTGPYTGGNYNIPGGNVVGGQNQGTVVNASQPIFNVDGMYFPFNTAFVDPTKPWNEQRKLVGRYLGIRLYYDNLSNKSVNLYSTSVQFRPFYR